MTNRKHSLLAILGVLALWVGTPRVLFAQSENADPFGELDSQLNQKAGAVLQQLTELLPRANADPAIVNTAPSTFEPAQTPLRRVDMLRPTIDPILREAGIPTELAAVVIVESGGRPTALSPKGALGLWQLMPETARRYGLIVDADRDDRLDIFKSTRAAAAYLRDLYEQFHDWPLALAAYNAGEQAVQRAITRTGTKEFSIVSQALPRETRNYVPAVLNEFSVFRLPTVLRSSEHGALKNILYAAAAE